MVSHILVALDGSEQSLKAIALAGPLAQQTDARLTLLFVVEPRTLIPFRRNPGEPYDRDVQDPAQFLEQIRVELRQRLERVIVYGRAAEVICDQAQKRRVDLVVIGSNGLGGGPSWQLGSVSDRVLRHLEAPVLVVH